MCTKNTTTESKGHFKELPVCAVKSTETKEQWKWQVAKNFYLLWLEFMFLVSLFEK